MSEPCEFEFVPWKRAVRDSVAQIGNHTLKYEASIQSETVLNGGETENSSTVNWKQDIKGNTKMYDTFGYLNKFKTKTSVSRRQRIEQILERCQSLLQYYNVVQIGRLVSTRPWIPHSTTG